MGNLILSMTGFGRASAALGQRTVSVEVRSLNHRGLDVKVRAHELRLAPEIENAMLAMVRARFARGSIVIGLSEESMDGAGELVDSARVRKIHAVLEDLRTALGLAEPVGLATVGAFLTTSRSGPISELPAACWPELSAAVSAALDGVSAMRTVEGAAILRDIERRAANLRALVDHISDLVAAVPARAAHRLEERLAALVSTTPALDPSRLAQEVAVLAERLDVSEEIVRLRAHLDHLARLLAGNAPDAPGRRIDFLAQEIGRELNTLGAKCREVGTAEALVDAKTAAERIREQVQNLE